MSDMGEDSRFPKKNQKGEEKKKGKKKGPLPPKRSIKHPVGRRAFCDVDNRRCIRIGRGPDSPQCMKMAGMNPDQNRIDQK